MLQNVLQGVAHQEVKSSSLELSTIGDESHQLIPQNNSSDNNASDQNADVKEKIKKPDKELVTSSDSERNWKGLLLALLVIAIVCSLVGLSAWVLQPEEDELLFQHKYEFDSMFDPQWKPFIVKGKWIEDKYIYQDRFKNVKKYQNGKVETLISNNTYSSFGTNHYSISNDQKYALFAFETKKLYRHSFQAKYFIFDINIQQHTSLSSEMLDYADWGRRGNDIVYVMNGDLYYKKSTTDEAQRITFTGEVSNGNIRNGISDWVYEEEVFSSPKANWLSSDGSYIAYAFFNDSEVPQISILSYDTSEAYPQENKIHYPKAGFPNPEVSVFVHHIEKNLTTQILSHVSKTPILWNFAWISDEQFTIKWSNRYQNETKFSTCFITLSDGRLQIDRSPVEPLDSVAGWNEYLKQTPIFGTNGSYFQIEESYHGGMGSFYHIKHSQVYKTVKHSRFLTNGNYEVTEILSYNNKTREVYYISNEQSVGDRHVYSVKIDTLQKKCFSCDMKCSYATASMSETSQHVMIQCLGPDVPFTKIININTKESITLEGNDEITSKLNATYLPRVLHESVEIEMDNDKHTFTAKLLLPVNYKLKKLPLFVSIYAGPGSQKVDSRFSLDWNTYLATYHDMAIMLFDGRGSGFKGTKILKSVNRKLGTYEIEDHISAIRQVLDKHSYLDPSKVSVFGWSYGGYAAAMTATNKQSLDANLIKCAISIAPVTDWRYYDSIYTERYMGSPGDNMNGYNEADLTSRAQLFSSFNFLLIHGLEDDNVHYQNSAMLERALVNAQVQHDMQVYTNENHSLSGAKAQRHLYRLMTDFLMKKCF